MQSLQNSLCYYYYAIFLLYVTFLNFTENSAVNNYTYATFSVKFLFRCKCDLMFKQQYMFLCSDFGLKMKCF